MLDYCPIFPSLKAAVTNFLHLSLHNDQLSFKIVDCLCFSLDLKFFISRSGPTGGWSLFLKLALLSNFVRSLLLKLFCKVCAPGYENVAVC